MRNLLLLTSWVFGSLGLAACSDGPSPARDAASDAPVGSEPDGGDAGPDAPPLPGVVGPLVLSLSPSGHDRLLGVTHDAMGNILAVGWAQSGTDAAGDRATIVARIKPDGTLDPTFGQGGVATINVVVGGNGEEFRGIAMQSGKIVIAGTVEHIGGPPNDRDVAVVRLGPSGAVDTTFGTNGVVTLNLSDPVVPDGGTNGVGVDSAGYNVLVQPDGKVVVPAALRAQARTDTDFALVRLLPDGALDPSFGTAGVFSIDVELGSANVRTATLLADGSIVAAGYTTPPGGTQRPIVYKVGATGVLDGTFGSPSTPGVFNEVILTQGTEAYGAALQGTSFVTAGYGRDLGDPSLDWVSLRLTAAGKLDPTYASNGVARIDFYGQSDNARAVVVLPDQRIMIVGGARFTATDSNAALVMLGKDGAPDESFGPGGKRLFDLGGAADFFWAADIGPDNKTVAIVGAMQVAADAGTHDESVLMIIPVQ